MRKPVRVDIDPDSLPGEPCFSEFDEGKRPSVIRQIPDWYWQAKCDAAGMSEEARERFYSTRLRENL